MVATILRVQNPKLLSLNAGKQCTPARQVAQYHPAFSGSRAGSGPTSKEGDHFEPVDTPKAVSEGISSRDKQKLRDVLPVLKRLEKEEAYSAKSKTNVIYRALYPREQGVVVYGSARVKEGTPEYQFGVDLGKALGDMTLNRKQAFVVTGGGPGSMQAIAEGALAVKAHSVGCAMKFIGETHDTKFYPEFVVHPTFHERLNGVGGYQHRGAYTVSLPGGWGTLHELVKKAEELHFDKTPYPCQKQIILMDYDHFFTFPGGFMSFLEFMILKEKVNPDVKKIFKIAKTPEEAVAFLKDPKVPWTQGENGKIEQ